jgi:predicted O-methyltransferase YrrM
MFKNIPGKVLARMQYLEAIDARDRVDGTPRLQRLRQISPETGSFLTLLAASAPPGQVIEIGASAGYSSLWLALACRERGDRLVTMEILESKAALTRQTISEAGLDDVIVLIQDDARRHISEFPAIAFCFLDAEKDVYQDCYDLVVPNLVSGGILLADNVVSHAVELAPLVEQAKEDERLDAMVVPLGKGLLFGRKW